MCGICGIVNRDRGRAVSAGEIRAMRESLRHRGPDDEGEWLGQGAALGHRRLSIIDIEGGRQPMSNEDGTLLLVFNGEIYNYRELRERLVQKGHVFKTASDAEVLLHLYEEEGEAAPASLVGMFAFAIWDAKSGTLFLARDHIGQKPLYYWEGRERFAFASELKAFKCLRDFDEPVSSEAISHYLTFQYIPHPLSIFKNVYKLPPAHYALLRDGRAAVRRYWSPFEPHVERRVAVRSVVEDAVRACMVSDVPVGALLSGGIDSTIVTGLMSREAREPVRAFTIGFEEEKYDEREYAAEAARRFGVENIQEVARPDVLNMFARLVRDLDEPMADSSAAPMSILARLAAGHVKVVLSGDGGDEAFLGYDRYRAVRAAAKMDAMPRFLRRLFFGRVWEHLPAPLEQKSARRRWKRFVGSLESAPARRYYEWISIFSDEEKRELLGGGAADSFAFLRDSGYAKACVDEVGKAAAFDIEYYLPCDLMAKVDRTCMAASLEARAPFLDHRVVESAVRIPENLRLKGREGKRVLRRAFADLLPRRIARRSKMGFGVPVGRWLREEMREMVADLLAKGGKLGGFVDGGAVGRIVAEHLDGRADHGARLWALLCLEEWLRQFGSRAGV
jgi:asparagine synthase (glutamine-hydrolysing)